MIPISTVLFDYGNVLSLPQPVDAAQRLADLCGLTLAPFEERYWMSRAAYDLGELDGPGYWSLFRAEEGHALTSAQIAAIIQADAESWERPNMATVRWAHALREHGVRTAILSNMPAPLKAHLLEHCGHEAGGWLPPFDHLTFSCDIGVMKPAAAIYQHALQGVGAAASETLFLDDRPENVEAARALGIHAVQFHSAQQVAAELEARYALPALDELRANAASDRPLPAS